MAVSLLRLFERSGRAEFLAGARSAFRYEEQAFDPQLGSWPDLRAATAAQRGFDAWCHGAGGIAIARLQAMRSDILLRDHHRSVAITALERTHEALCESIDSPQRDEGLCHGTIGLAEICRIGGRMLSVPTFSPKVDQAAATVAEGIIDMASEPRTRIVANFIANLLAVRGFNGIAELRFLDCGGANEGTAVAHLDISESMRAFLWGALCRHAAG